MELFDLFDFSLSDKGKEKVTKKTETLLPDWLEDIFGGGKQDGPTRQTAVTKARGDRNKTIIWVVSGAAVLGAVLLLARRR